MSESDLQGSQATERVAILDSADVGRRVVHGGAVRIAGFAIVNLLGVAGIIILQRTLGIDDYGRYGTVLALVAVVGLITDAGLTITGSRELALHERGADRRAFLGAVFGVRLALSVAGMACCVAFGLIAGYPATMVAGIALASVGAILLSGQAAVALPFAVDLRNARLTLTEIVKQAILFAGIAFVAILGAGLVQYLLVQVAVGAGALALTYLLLGRHDRSRPRFDLGAWRELARTALPVAVASVLGMAYVRILVVLASLLTNERETGLVAASARVVEIASGLSLLLWGVVLPVAAVAARDDRSRLRYIVTKTTEVGLLVGALVAIVLALAARPLVVLLGSSDFAAAAPVLQIHAAAVATFFVIQAWVTMLIADGRQRVVVRASAGGLATVLVAGAVLIPLYDARGAAAAAIAADVTMAIGLLVGLRAVSGHAWPTSASFLGRFLVLLAAALAVGVLLPVPAAAAATIAALVFAGGAVTLRLIASEIFDAIPRRPAGGPGSRT